MRQLATIVLALWTCALLACGARTQVDAHDPPAEPASAAQPVDPRPATTLPPTPAAADASCLPAVEGADLLHRRDVESLELSPSGAINPWHQPDRVAKASVEPASEVYLRLGVDRGDATIERVVLTLRSANLSASGADLWILPERDRLPESWAARPDASEAVLLGTFEDLSPDEWFGVELTEWFADRSTVIVKVTSRGDPVHVSAYANFHVEAVTPEFCTYRGTPPAGILQGAFELSLPTPLLTRPHWIVSGTDRFFVLNSEEDGLGGAPFVAAISPADQLLWSTDWTGHGSAYAAAPTPDGGLVVLLRARKVDFGSIQLPDEPRLALVRLSPEGTPIWVRSFVERFEDGSLASPRELLGVRVTPAGHVAVLAKPGNALELDDGTRLPGPGALAVFDAGGALLWTHELPAMGWAGLVVQGDDLVVAGAQGPRSTTVQSYDPAGKLRWSVVSAVHAKALAASGDEILLVGVRLGDPDSATVGLEVLDGNGQSVRSSSAQLKGSYWYYDDWAAHATPCGWALLLDTAWLDTGKGTLGHPLRFLGRPTVITLDETLQPEWFRHVPAAWIAPRAGVVSLGIERYGPREVDGQEFPYEAGVIQILELSSPSCP